jgi:histidinol dehydrogenase
MTAVPAQVAGVGQIAIVAPPTENGAYNPHVLATCHELGIEEVYRVGGAQAVASLAYGVDGLAKVDKIVGPGNLFVALAKKFVFGHVDIDSIAGPSEVVVIADGSVPLAARFRAGRHVDNLRQVVVGEDELVRRARADHVDQIPGPA